MTNNKKFIYIAIGAFVISFVAVFAIGLYKVSRPKGPTTWEYISYGDNLQYKFYLPFETKKGNFLIHYFTTDLTLEQMAEKLQGEGCLTEIENDKLTFYIAQPDKTYKFAIHKAQAVSVGWELKWIGENDRG